MTPQQFSIRLQGYGINMNPQDVATLWRATGITSDCMQFNDFIRFLQAESINVPSSSPSNVSPDILLDTLRSNKRALLMKFIEADPRTSGRISHRAFSDICSWFGSAENQSDTRQIISRYDPMGKGVFNYFNLMSDLVEDDHSAPINSYSYQSNQGYPTSPTQAPASPRFSPKAPPIDVSYSHSPERNLNYDNNSYNFGLSNQNSSPKSPNKTPTSSGGRNRLDPAIFGTSSQQQHVNSGTSSGGRGRLDPAIFGQRSPTSDSVPEQPVQHADDFVNAEHVSGLTPNQYVELISKQVSRVSRGSKQCYSRWRGNLDLLDATAIRDGLAKDANIVLPYRDLELIVNHYGGPMNLSSFVRMLSDGSQYAEQNKTIDGVRKATEDEASIIQIADQVIGTKWEEYVLRSSSAEEVARGFAQLGIEADSNVIRRLMAKLGSNGFVDAIKARIK